MLMNKIKVWKKEKKRNRSKLRKKANRWINGTAIISNIDINSIYNPKFSTKVCLTNVSIGKRFFPHIWVASEFIYQNFLTHDTIQFKAKIKRYTRKDGSIAFGLSDLKDIELIKGVCY